MPCVLTRRGGEKSELLGSSYHEAGDLRRIKAIIVELSEGPLSTLDVVSRLTEHTPSTPKEKRWRTFDDILSVMGNLHLVEKVSGKKWVLSPYGKAWARLDSSGDFLGSSDKAFLLKHLLMIDSHNCGLWITFVLGLAEDESVEKKTIVESFRKRMESLEIRMKGSAEHKVQLAISWSVALGLLAEERTKYKLTAAGKAVAKLHDSFLDHGVQAYREKAAAIVLEALKLIGLEIEESLEPNGGFGIEEVLVAVESKLRNSPDWPVDLPQLRAICCTRSLLRGVPLSDAEFDRSLLDLSTEMYYKYQLLRSSKATTPYPYQGIEDSKGSFYYLDIVRD